MNTSSVDEADAAVMRTTSIALEAGCSEVCHRASCEEDKRYLHRVCTRQICLHHSDIALDPHGSWLGSKAYPGRLMVMLCLKLIAGAWHSCYCYSTGCAVTVASGRNSCCLACMEMDTK